MGTAPYQSPLTLCPFSLPPLDNISGSATDNNTRNNHVMEHWRDLEECSLKTFTKDLRSHAHLPLYL